MTQQTAESLIDTDVVFSGKRRFDEDAMRVLDDIRRAMMRCPDDARAAAARLVNLLNRPAPDRAMASGGLAPWQKLKIERHLKSNFIGPLRVRELAAQASLSASYFHHAFRQSFGTSPHAYIMKLRLERAQQMMLSTQEPLSQIAFACGFSDQSHFCRVFRATFGEPPGIWRRRSSYGMESDKSATHAIPPAAVQENARPLAA